MSNQLTIGLPLKEAGEIENCTGYEDIDDDEYEYDIVLICPCRSKT